MVGTTGSIPFARDDRHEAVATVARASQTVFGGALKVFARHPVAILACSLLCFAGAAIIGSIAYAALTLNAYLRSDSYFSATQQIYTSHFYLRAVLGAFLFVLGRGAITWIALRDESHTPAGWRDAIRAAADRWPALALSSLLYGLIISAGTFGLTLLLRELRLDLSNFRWLRNGDASSLLTAISVQAIALLPPDPGSPFSELFGALRYTYSRLSGTSYYSWQNYAFRVTPSSETLRIGVLSVISMVLAETILCMRTAAVMASDQRSATRWFFETVTLSLRHFTRVLIMRWGLRLLIAAIVLTGLIVPTLLHQGVVVPIVAREMRSYWTYPVNTAIYTVTTALSGMLLIAFQTVYEARLFASLRHRDATVS